MKFNSKDAKQWLRMGPRAMFGQFMIDIAKKNKKLIVLSADLGRSSGLARFKIEFPKQYISVGISEQNLVGIAAGLADEGFKVFVTSFAPFLSMRASEQIRMNLGYMKHSVNLVALGSGLSMGFLGNSHFGLEDIAIMRTIPNLNITCPSDCSELGSKNVYDKNYTYNFGKNITIHKGKDVLVLCHGSILGQVKLSIKNLQKMNINAELVNVVSLKPIDERITSLLKKFQKIITIEEHTSVGGLGSIMAEKILKNKIKTRLCSISLPDKFGPTGTYDYLLKYHGLDTESITKKIISFVKKK